MCVMLDGKGFFGTLVRPLGCDPREGMARRWPHKHFPVYPSQNEHLWL